MGKTRDLFKKIRDTKGTFHAKMGSIKERKGMDLTESEDIKKRWQEYCIANGKYTQYFVIITKGKTYPLNAEFHRIVRRDKKTWLSDQYKQRGRQ